MAMAHRGASKFDRPTQKGSARRAVGMTPTMSPISPVTAPAQGVGDQAQRLWVPGTLLAIRLAGCSPWGGACVGV